jgi:hypothetical protein
MEDRERENTSNKRKKTRKGMEERGGVRVEWYLY